MGYLWELLSPPSHALLYCPGVCLLLAVESSFTGPAGVELRPSSRWFRDTGAPAGWPVSGVLAPDRLILFGLGGSIEARHGSRRGKGRA